MSTVAGPLVVRFDVGPAIFHLKIRYDCDDRSPQTIYKAFVISTNLLNCHYLYYCNRLLIVRVHIKLGAYSG